MVLGNSANGDRNMRREKEGEMGTLLYTLKCADNEIR